MRILPVLLLAAALPAWTATPRADERVPLGAAARERAGIRTEAAVDAAAAAGPAPALRLNGRVVVPNAAIDIVSAPLGGRLAALSVNTGQRVRAGETVARLQGPELIEAQRAYLAAMVAADLARSRLVRDEQLAQSGLIPTNRLEATRAEARLADANLAGQRQLLRLFGLDSAAIGRIRDAADIRTEVDLRAPRAGVVLQVDAGLAQVLEAGAPVLRIAAADTLWIDLQATREQARGLAVGDVVRVSGCAGDGRLLSAGAQLDAASQTLLLRAAVPAADGCILPNQFVLVEVAPRSAREAGLVSLPREAVVRRGSTQHAFVARDGGFVAVEVEVVRTVGDRQLVRGGGVQAGEQVAVSGTAALKGAWLGLGQPADAEGTP
jgi:membrane fusion protein, heavy metal efflux system